jgi:hypothetical protein
MKRSAQIGLVVMGALGTTAGAGYLATNRDQACQTGAQNPQATPGQECRRSIWSGGGHSSGWSRPIFGGTSSSSSPGVTSSHASPGTAASRGGFGGHAGHGGGSAGG